MGQKLAKNKIWDIGMGLISLLSFFIPWMGNGDSRASIAGYLFRVIRYRDISETYCKIMLPGFEGNISDAYKFAVCYLILIIGATLLRFLFLYYLFEISKDSVGSKIPMGLLLAVVALAGYVLLEEYMANINIYEKILSDVVPGKVIAFWVAYVIFLLLWLIGGLVAGNWDERSRIVRKEKQARRRYRRERKKRLAFPGHYSKLLPSVLWHDFFSQKTDAIFLFSASFMMVFLIDTGMTLRSVLEQAFSENMGYLGVTQGLSLTDIITKLLVIIFFFALCIITLVMTTYRKNRMDKTGLFQILGMRKSLLRFIEIFEMVFVMVCGMLAGMIVTVLFSKIFLKLFFAKILEQTTVPESGAEPALLTIAFFFLISLFAFGFSSDSYWKKNSADARGEAVKGEPVPRRRLPAKIAFFAALLLLFLKLYGERRFAESVYLLCAILAAAAFLVSILMAGWLRRLRHDRERYFKKLPQIHMLQYRFRTSAGYIALFFCIQICVLFYFTMIFGSNVLGSAQESSYPYDFILFANSQDDTYLDQLRTSCRAEVTEFPMIRVTTMDNTERLEAPGVLIYQQGQNIGISESTYRELKALKGETVSESLHLDDDGEKIYVVYQQDMGSNAKPLDWYMLTKEPYLHIGQPLLGFNTMEYRTYYPQRQIIGSETDSLIGSFRQGKYENLVVFSDAYFETVRDSWKYTDANTGEQVDAEHLQEGETIHESPTRLVLAHVPEENIQKAEEIVEQFRDAHAYDEEFDVLVKSAYVKSTAEKQRSIEHATQIVMAAMICVMLIMVNLMVLNMKIRTELSEMKRRYQFMQCFGMHKKECRELLKMGIRYFALFPFAVSVPLSATLTAIVMALRGFSREDVVLYIAIGIGVIGSYMLIMWLDSIYLRRKAVKEIDI